MSERQPRVKRRKKEQVPKTNVKNEPITVLPETPESVKSQIVAVETVEIPEGPVISVNPEKLLRWAARMKTSGNFGIYGNGANFANHMVKDSFTVDGKEISIEQAAKLIRPHTRI